jgi:hypothetical protein
MIDAMTVLVSTMLSCLLLATGPVGIVMATGLMASAGYRCRCNRMRRSQGAGVMASAL